MKDEPDQKLFVLGWPEPQGDATVMVLCEYCGVVRYSSTENIQAARSAKMKFVCIPCTQKLIQEDEVVFSGTVRHGSVKEAKAEPILGIVDWTKK